MARQTLGSTATKTRKPKTKVPEFESQDTDTLSPEEETGAAEAETAEEYKSRGRREPSINQAMNYAPSSDDDSLADRKGALPTQRVGIYVDSANVAQGGGYGMQYEVLRDFACHDNGEVVKLSAYLPFDVERADEDPDYRRRTQNFFATLRDIGYKVVEKRMRRHTDDDGNVTKKANCDLDLAVDVLTQSERLDRILLVTGDGDFLRMVRAVQDRGVRVETIAFNSISADLRKEVDLFIPGYLVPNLLPLEDAPSTPWGQLGSRVRGYCYFHSEPKHFGFMRFLDTFEKDLHITDTKNPRSPYLTAFFHDTNLPPRLDPATLPNREVFFEFDLAEGKDPGQIEAKNIEIAGVIPLDD